MPEKIFKCVVCAGNDYPCILAVSSTGSIADNPTKCPFNLYNPKWEEVKE